MTKCDMYCSLQLVLQLSEKGLQDEADEELRYLMDYLWSGLSPVERAQTQLEYLEFESK